MTNDAERVKACPFCGSRDTDLTMEDEIYNGKKWYYLECAYCGTRGPTEPKALKALELWNDRQD